MNGFRNSSRNGQVWRWQRTGHRAVNLEIRGFWMEAVLADLCAYRESYPSTQADNLLLQWSKRHCPDYFALLVMVIEARSMVDAQGQPLKYVPGESARTRLLWAEILHSGKLSPN